MKRIKKYKISRRLQAPLFEKCQSQKFVVREQRRPQKRQGRVSEYGKQLMEKQKVRYLYSISESVLKNYVRKAISTKGESAESTLVEMLERRLDNVVYQLGLVPTRRMARQMVSHGHFTVNGRRTTVPSYHVRDKDEIGIREGSTRTPFFQGLLSAQVKPKVKWVSWNGKTRTGAVSDQPVIEDSIISLPIILEYYSR